MEKEIKTTTISNNIRKTMIIIELITLSVIGISVLLRIKGYGRIMHYDIMTEFFYTSVISSIFEIIGFIVFMFISSYIEYQKREYKDSIVEEKESLRYIIKILKKTMFPILIITLCLIGFSVFLLMKNSNDIKAILLNDELTHSSTTNILSEVFEKNKIVFDMFRIFTKMLMFEIIGFIILMNIIYFVSFKKTYKGEINTESKEEITTENNKKAIDDEEITTENNEKSIIKSVIDSPEFCLPYFIFEDDCYYQLITVREDGGETLEMIDTEDTIVYKTLNDEELPYMIETEEFYLIYVPKNTKIKQVRR